MTTTKKASVKPRLVPTSEAPAIVPGVTYAKDGDSDLIVREVVLLGPTSAAVYLAQRFTVDEIQFFVQEPTKRLPEGRQFWKRTPRIGARGQ